MGDYFVVKLSTIGQPIGQLGPTSLSLSVVG